MVIGPSPNNFDLTTRGSVSQSIANDIRQDLRETIGVTFHRQVDGEVLRDKDPFRVVLRCESHDYLSGEVSQIRGCNVEVQSAFLSLGE